MESCQESSKCFKKASPKAAPVIVPDIFQDTVQNQLKELFAGNLNQIKGTPLEASRIPFPHCVVNNFLQNIDTTIMATSPRKITPPGSSPAKEFVAELRDKLLGLEFHQKSNDLYKFTQTSELMTQHSSPGVLNSDYHLQHFASLIKKTMLPWLRDITGTTLNDDIDMFCAQYASTDCLLCHDDELEYRRFAYVYYLTPDWSSSDGGTLDLFDSKVISTEKEIFDPNEIVKSIVPFVNSLVIFEVSPKSFHQVSEVLSDKTRVSLTGWFHGPTSPRHVRKSFPASTLTGYTPSKDSSLLSKWISSLYLNLGTQGSIQEQFTQDSEIQLNDFLLNEVYESLDRSLSHLQNKQAYWKSCGPANKCCYHKFSPPSLSNEDKHSDSGTSLDKLSPTEDQKDSLLSLNVCSDDTITSLKIIDELIELFTSEEMFLFLSNCTGLSFHPMAVDSDSENEKDGEDEIPAKRSKRGFPPGTNSGCRYQLRKWEKGSYTLLSDSDCERGEFALDLNLFIKADDWKIEFGGLTSYIAANKDEELLTVVPSPNVLSLAYRDEDALRFVKHINHTATGTFYDLCFTYYE